MKTPTIVFIIFALCNSINAQITLEHNYSFSGSMVEIDDGEFKFFVMDVPLSQCRIYNEDHSQFKIIDLSVPAGYYLYDIKYISRKIFNSDNLIELLYIYNKLDVINSQNVNTYGMKVVNEEGSVLLSLTNGGFAEIKKNSEGPKLLAYQYIWNDSYYLINTSVYALGGSTKAIENESGKGLCFAPNPFDEQLTINLGNTSSDKGKLILTDMAGKVVLTKPYSRVDETMVLPMESFLPGTYILNLETDEGIKASEKIVKK